MKKRSIGWKLLVLGSMMTLSVACQPKTPKVPESRFAQVNEVSSNSDNTEQDIDAAVYGTNDTSSSVNEEIAQTNFDSAQIISDIHEVLEQTIIPAVDIAVAETESANEVVLEPVYPIEIQALHQEDISDNSQN